VTRPWRLRQVFLVQPVHPAGVARLRAAGLSVRQATAPDMATVGDEMSDADAAVTRNAGLSAAAMDRALALRVVVVHGVGYDPVDVAHATARGILVCNTPDANTESVAEHALGLMLALARRTVVADRAVREGRYGDRYRLSLTELRGKTLGIIGCGRVGIRTATLARRALGMQVLGYSRSRPGGRLRQLGIQPASLDTLLERSDVVSLHLVLTPETHGLIGRRELRRMKAGAFLVNTARGALVDEGALVEALRAGRLGGAGLDVFAGEPLAPGHPLTELDAVVLSPHVAGSTREALERTALAVAEAILRVARGRRPAHLLNPGTWPRRRPPR
jgi:D-3-phosphoglycerate dehydrogenase